MTFLGVTPRVYFVAEGKPFDCLQMSMTKVTKAEFGTTKNCPSHRPEHLKLLRRG